MINSELIQKISNEHLIKKELEVSILRLDKLHPIISGNKLFKLKYHLSEAIAKGKKRIITMGGPYSNHLVATAFAAKQAGLGAIGLVRGEKPVTFSHTLNDCIQFGMELVFMERDQFNQVIPTEFEEKFPDAQFISHGGYGELGAKGSAEILNFDEAKHYHYILAACGTGTMGAGLINASDANQKIILISTLKNNFSISQEIETLIDEESKTKNNLSINFDFHLGGYAKKNDVLFETMNQFYLDHGIETDFVYTGKLIYAFNKMTEQDYFKKKSSVLLIHSGGLQGNRSLQNGELNFET